MPDVNNAIDLVAQEIQIGETRPHHVEVRLPQFVAADIEVAQRREACQRRERGRFAGQRDVKLRQIRERSEFREIIVGGTELQTFQLGEVLQVFQIGLEMVCI